MQVKDPGKKVRVFFWQVSVSVEETSVFFWFLPLLFLPIKTSARLLEVLYHVARGKNYCQLSLNHDALPRHAKPPDESSGEAWH